MDTIDDLNQLGKNLSRRQFIELSLAISGITLMGCDSTKRKSGSMDNPKKLISELSTSKVNTFISEFKGQIVLPSDSQYQALRRICNYKYDKYPGMIALCNNASDVKRAVSFASEYEILVSVRSGGHSLGGYSTCDGGLIIDLSQLKGVDVNADNQIANIQGGTTIGDIDKELSISGLATPGAGAATVGYAGFATGGGRGTISPRYGLACDNIQEVDIITPDGQLHTISKTSKPDLFWGVCGGGGNFGIITRFKVKAHKVPEVVAGNLVFPFKEASNSIKRIRDLLSSVPKELYVAPILAGTPEGPILALNLLYCGPLEKAQKVIAPYYSVGKLIKDTISEVPYLDTQAWFPGPPKGTAIEGCSGFFPEFTDKIIDSLVASAKDGPASFTIPSFSMHGALADKSLDKNAYPLRMKGVDFFAMGFWTSPKDRELTQQWANNLWDTVASATRGTFVNGFFDKNIERARLSYLDKFERLTKIKAKYDPANLFSQNVNIQPS
jgi:hypothetical protein